MICFKEAENSFIHRKVDGDCSCDNHDIVSIDYLAKAATITEKTKRL